MLKYTAFKLSVNTMHPTLTQALIALSSQMTIVADQILAHVPATEEGDRTIRKCPGVKTLIPSSSQDKGTSGLLLRQASICVKTVVNSSKVSFMLDTIHFK